MCILGVEGTLLSTSERVDFLGSLNSIILLEPFRTALLEGFSWSEDIRHIGGMMICEHFPVGTIEVDMIWLPGLSVPQVFDKNTNEKLFAPLAVMQQPIV